MRTFIALELPPAFVDETSALARQLKGAIDGRFMAPDTYHVTLAFLGDIAGGEASRAIDALDTACANVGPIGIASDGLGKFGRAEDATLWLGLRDSPELENLVARIREELRECNVPFDEKPFRPHITLARRARLPKGALPAMAFPLDDVASRVTLFKSTLGSDGATYEPLHTLTLGTTK